MRTTHRQRLKVAVNDGDRADIKYALDRIVAEQPCNPDTNLMAEAIAEAVANLWDNIDGG